MRNANSLYFKETRVVQHETIKSDFLMKHLRFQTSTSEARVLRAICLHAESLRLCFWLRSGNKQGQGFRNLGTALVTIFSSCGELVQLVWLAETVMIESKCSFESGINLCRWELFRGSSSPM